MAAEVSNGPIIVGIDGSRFSREALRWALAESNHRHCPVRALMVTHTGSAVVAGRPASLGLGTMLPGEPGEEHLRLLETTVRSVVEEMTGDPRLDAAVVQGSAPEVLCSFSEGAQLLVLGSRGHGQLFEAVLGSVSQYCIRHAACPVVVIPARLVTPDVAPSGGGTQPQPVPAGS